MHRLLKRQLDRHGVNPEALEQSCQRLLTAVDEAYQQSDQDRQLLEHSLELMSAEMLEKNQLLEQQLATLNGTLNSIQDAVVAVNLEGQLVCYNDHLLPLLELDVDKLKTQGISHVMHQLSIRAKFPVFLHHVVEQLGKDPRAVLRGVVEMNNDQFVEFYSRPKLFNDDLHGRVWSFRDVTELQRQDQQIKFQAMHDMLTMLPNRQAFREHVDKALSRANRSGELIGVMFIDLDNFKDVNDLYGHQAGDKLLRTVAERLHDCIRQHDLLARLGGDEFIVLLDRLHSRAEVSAIALRILELAAQPLKVGLTEISLSASIGVHLSIDPEETTDDLIRKADMAMYEAKANGRNTFEFFKPELEIHARNRVSVGQRLHSALNTEQLLLHYQPLVRTRDQLIIGFEALLRWRCPEQGMISPADFIPIAEQSNLILKLGEWVLEESCKQLARWSRLYPHIRMSVNMSVKQLQDVELVNKLETLLIRYKLKPQSLELEITESMVVEDMQRVIARLHEIRALGIKIAIDDFGTGYSSLNYLRQLPIDTLKIDQSFMTDIDSSKSGAAIIDSIITLAHNLDLSVVAEGVEDPETYRVLVDAACDTVQGYLFSRPVEAEAISQMLAKSDKLALPSGQR